MSNHWRFQNEEKFTAGDTFKNGQYTVIRMIGVGGKGTVILVKDNEINTE